jgi:hypothetical protein
MLHQKNNAYGNYISIAQALAFFENFFEISEIIYIMAWGRGVRLPEEQFQKITNLIIGIKK